MGGHHQDFFVKRCSYERSHEFLIGVLRQTMKFVKEKKTAGVPDRESVHNTKVEVVVAHPSPTIAQGERFPKKKKVEKFE